MCAGLRVCSGCLPPEGAAAARWYVARVWGQQTQVLGCTGSEWVLPLYFVPRSWSLVVPVPCGPPSWSLSAVLLVLSLGVHRLGGPSYGPGI